MAGIPLRHIAHVLVACSMLAGASGAGAQGAYPNRPITIVIGFSAGGTTDIITRLISDELRKGLGQPIVIENRPGAAGNIGAELVAKAKPDGYTLLMGSVGPLAINASLYQRMAYDNLKDLAPITLVAHVPNMLVVNPRTVPAQTFQEFVALAKASPGKRIQFDPGPFSPDPGPFGPHRSTSATMSPAMPTATWSR
jgi:tripartite-type tricarboxylate transporter receptor subunit TctC